MISRPAQISRVRASFNRPSRSAGTATDRLRPNSDGPRKRAEPGRHPARERPRRRGCGSSSSRRGECAQVACNRCVVRQHDDGLTADLWHLPPPDLAPSGDRGAGSRCCSWMPDRRHITPGAGFAQPMIVLRRATRVDLSCALAGETCSAASSIKAASVTPDRYSRACAKREASTVVLERAGHVTTMPRCEGGLLTQERDR